ncbi:hypothetical protein [Azospirillum sp. A1-3]|nr:hypothetical protein [Azospirillum sp. A1-3]
MLKTTIPHTVATVLVIGALATAYQAVDGPSSIAGLWAAGGSRDH